MEEYWKSEILKLYGCLENIASTKDNENNDTERLVKHFEEFFEIKETEDQKIKLGFLKNKEFILKGKVDERQKLEIDAKWTHDCHLNGDSLLLRALSINVKRNSPRKRILDKIIRCIVGHCPELIRFEKIHDHCNGVTPLHLAIVQEDKKRLQYMAEKLSEEVDTTPAKDICATGAVFQDTVMMAGTLLGVASLKFNKEIFCIILKHFVSELNVSNEKGDNIIHSLVKYVHMQPEKLESALKMIHFILECEFINEGYKYEKTFERKQHNETSITKRDSYFFGKEWNFREQTRKLLMMKNKEKLTPLQLAAKRQQFKIFEEIIHHEVYITRESNDGLFNEDIYDITEIETLSIESDINASHEENIKSEHHESVLEYVVHHQTKNAFLFTNVTPVKEVIREKWKYYRPWFLTWFAFHLLFMVLLSYAAVLRSEAIGTSENAGVSFDYRVKKDGFVTTVSLLGLIFAVFIVSMEGVRKYTSRFKSQTSSDFKKRIARHFSLPYSNFMFRIYFFLFSLLLTVDFIFAAAMASGSLSGYDNYCLIFAVIIGWYLVLFFLQVFKVFSFYTVLIQRVILDMLKFAFVMGIFLISFSIAMFMVLQGADTKDDDFNHLGKTMVKMLTIMLGIGEIDILFQARQPILAVIVFVLFVLLTTILLLNALIAMMSNSCTDLMSKNAGVVAEKMHYRLQKLSVILLLESFLPRRFCKTVGTLQKKIIYDNESNKYQEKRRRQWKRNYIHGHVQSESDTVDEPLQLTHSILDIHSIFGRIIPWQYKSHNSKTNKSRKVGPEIPEVFRLQNVQSRLDITDIERTNCSQCQKESASFTQTQEIIQVRESTESDAY